ncbi:single-stranded DNA-dependent ATPase [Fragilaria crotonensis]|nr:single-stranded DNA-dependent ATPase [Fragilaria crotonensis]
MTEKAAENKDKLLARHDQCKALKEVTAEARKVYKKIAEEVLLKCPHCKLERGAYDGTIALPCKCGAAFCAKCLINCADIHQHVKQHHGGPSATDMASASKMLRIEGIVRSHLRRIAKGSGELIQLVNNHLQNAGHLQNKIPVDTRSRLTQQFLVKATSDLDSAVLNDRSSLLSQPGRVKGPLTMSMISPRNSIQSGYRVRLTIDNEGNSYLSLYKEQGTDWVEVPLEGTEDEALVDSLVNLKGSFRCGVIAISGEPCLYQTRIENHVICFHRVDSSGHVGRACSLSGDHIVLALNSNKRITSLQTHAKTFPARKLMLDPILHLIGAGNPQALLDAIASPVPQTVFALNEQQRCVAHPLRVKTAMEVAGPPGTGKTKTITELTRSLLECTKYNIIVFSERNGAIDAIAEKIFQTTMTSTGAIESQTQHFDVHDLEMWSHVLTFGSKGMGHHTKLFSLPTKIE